MVDATNPWSARGGNYDNSGNAGAFAFSRNNGQVVVWISFRQSKITNKSENL